jgi:hypothetical protein
MWCFLRRRFFPLLLVVSFGQLVFCSPKCFGQSIAGSTSLGTGAEAATATADGAAGTQLNEEGDAAGPPSNAVLWAMAALSFAQMGMNLFSSEKNRGSHDYSSESLGLDSSSPAGGAKLPRLRPNENPISALAAASRAGTLSPETQSQFEKMKMGLANLAKKGVVPDLDRNVVITPEGEIPNAALASKEALMGAGFSEAVANDVFKKVKKVEKEVEKVLASKSAERGGGYDIGGYNGGGARGSRRVIGKRTGRDLSGQFDSMFAGLLGNDRNRRAEVSGLHKNLKDGSPVGVARESIFDMISRRYRSQGF